MRKILVLLVVISICLNVYSQVPEGMKYQAIARDKNGKELVSQSIGLRFSILMNSPTGKAVYLETQNATTNSYGLFSVDIGMGTVDSGSFSQINWAKGSYFIRVEMDASGGKNYIIMGVSPILSVPYSLHSKTADRALNDKDTIPQALRFSNDTLYLTNGGMVYLGGYSDKKDIQNLKTILKADSLNFINNLNTEIINRKNGDSVLNISIVNNATNLTNETNLRIAGDNNQKAKENADSSYLKGLINTNTTNITNETNNRISSYNSLKTKVVSDSNYLKGAINTETTNRTNSDNTLQTNINNAKVKESSDSSLFAGYLNTTITSLTTETNSRIAGDNSLKSKVVSDSNYLRGMVNTTNTNLTNETNNRMSGYNTQKAKEISDSSYLKGLINTANTNLTNETNSRISGDNNLKTMIVTDSSTLRGLINTTSTNLSTEITNRTNGDNTLQTNINNQKSKEVSDSSYLKGLINTTNSNLSTEITNRTSGDNTLQTNINNQKSKEISDSSYLKGQINTTNNNLSTEITNRTNGDNTLQTNINNQKSKEISDSSYLRGIINSYPRIISGYVYYESGGTTDTICSGTGFTVSTTTGTYPTKPPICTITFNKPFTNTPVITVSYLGNIQAIINFTTFFNNSSINKSSFSIYVTNTSGNYYYGGIYFSFIAIGQ